jgi:hypothetical protein
MIKFDGLRQLKSSLKLKSVVMAREIVVKEYPNTDCQEESIILIDVNCTLSVFTFNLFQSGLSKYEFYIYFLKSSRLIVKIVLSLVVFVIILYIL